MPTGKLASQAGHAFLGSLLKASSDIYKLYTDDPPGTKIVLKARNLEHLKALYAQIASTEVPAVLVTDSGHFFPPHFTGEPIITALGLGPALRDEVFEITKDLELA